MKSKKLILRGLALAGGAAIALVGTGTVAEAQDRIRWQMASGYAGAFVHLGTMGKRIETLVSQVSGGTFEIKFQEPGALVPALQVMDGVSNGSIEAGWVSAGQYAGRNTALALFSAVPFGPEAGEFLAWMRFGGGQELMDELHAPLNIKPLVCGITPPEASGWFRQEVKSLADLRGIRMRFFGLGARAVTKLGVQTTNQPGGELYQALQLGTIDATEFGQPALDLGLGLHQVAKHYYFPGWHQPASLYHLYVHKPIWEKLTDSRKRLLEVVCGDNITYGLAEGEALQFKAMQELQARGVIFHTWGSEFIAAFRRGWDEVVVEEVGKNPDFKKIWESLTAFRTNYKVWSDRGYHR
jgi:TRAP-type mannitol/chloroaromatic compound transport system substrate-binding protein